MFEIAIPGAPRTKKNHGRIVPAGRFRKLLPSEAFEEWNKVAQMYFARYRAMCTMALPYSGEVNCRALFYRDALRGDAVGYYQALADALEEARIIENDRQIVSWNGSLLLKDAENPRIELVLTRAGQSCSVCGRPMDRTVAEALAAVGIIRS